MAHILLIIHDVVGSAMAGPGIRALELARVLATEHDVTLATPRPADNLPDTLKGVVYTWGDAQSLAPALDEAELIVANAYVLDGHPELAERRVPLVLDMYDPTPLENLALWRNRSPEERLAQSRRDIDLLGRQLRAGDCFLCATERQRDLYLGALLTLGRVAPDLADADPTLRGLLRVVPFGLSKEPPAPLPPPWEPLPNEQVILWSGGLWDWMDPLTLIRAMPKVLNAAPNARLVFLAGKHPGTAGSMTMPDQARALAAELGLSDTQVTFVDHWLPYNKRSGALLAAKVAVYLHEDSLETAYAAVRSRFLDHLWAGLPSLVSDGDAAAALVKQHGLGRVAKPGDVESTADALLALLTNPDELAACAAQARALAHTFTWEAVAQPLLEFCRNPQMTAERPAPRPQPITPPKPEELPEMPSAEQLDAEFAQRVAERDQRARERDAHRNELLQALAASYRLPEPQAPAGLVGRVKRVLFDHLVRPFIAPLLAQQNEYNAAVVRAFDALAEHADSNRSDLFTQLDVLDIQQRQRRELQSARIYADMHANLATLEQHTQQHIQTLRALIEDLDATDSQLAAAIANMTPVPPSNEQP